MLGILHLYVALFLLLGAPLNTLVDEEYGLPQWYDPGLRKETLVAWEELQAAAETDGLKVSIYSGYRSYQDQRMVFARETSKQGEVADLYSARPGHSEHQLGTTFDLAWAGLPVEFLDPRNQQLWEFLSRRSVSEGH